MRVGGRDHLRTAGAPALERRAVGFLRVRGDLGVVAMVVRE